jgi:hypothetical protein
MNKWSRNDKIALIGVILVSLAIIVTVVIPELRQFVGLESHDKSTVQQTKPLPESQLTKPSTKSEKQLSPSISKEKQKQVAKSEEPNKMQEPNPSSSVPKETAKQTTKPEEPANVQEPKPMERRGNIKVSCFVYPMLWISPNETATIKIFTHIYIPDRPSVSDLPSYADIFITAPGGTFPSTGTNTLKGKTDRLGYFETLWNPPKDIKGKFSLGVEVKKEGVGTGVGTCSGEIR